MCGGLDDYKGEQGFHDIGDLCFLRRDPARYDNIVSTPGGWSNLQRYSQNREYHNLENHIGDAVIITDKVICQGYGAWVDRYQVCFPLIGLKVWVKDKHLAPLEETGRDPFKKLLPSKWPRIIREIP